MELFATYWTCFAFDPKTNAIRLINSIRPPKLDVDSDVEAVRMA